MDINILIVIAEYQPKETKAISQKKVDLAIINLQVIANLNGDPNRRAGRPQDQTVRPKPIKRSLNTQNPPKTETNIRGELASSCPKWADTYIHT